MKFSMRFLLTGALFGLVAALFAAEGEVNANLLNVRLQPDVKSPVAVRLAKGAKVEVTGTQGEFLEIRAPENTPVYVSAVFVDNGALTREQKMHVSGSSSSASYGTLPKDAEVSVIEIDRYGWARLVPPDSIRLYVSRHYITMTEGAATAKPAPSEGDQPDRPASENPPATVDPAPSVEPPAEVELPPLPAKIAVDLKAIGVDTGKFQAVSPSGIFVELESTTVPIIRHALMRNGMYEYFVCSELDLKSYGNRPVSVKGRVFRVPNWTIPVLYVDAVTEVKSN